MGETKLTAKQAKEIVKKEIEESASIADLPLANNAPTTFSEMLDQGHRTFEPAIAAYICEQVIMRRSMSSICQDDGMPSISMVAKWLAHPKHEEFRSMLRFARETAAEMHVDHMFDVAANDEIDVQRAKLMISTYQWYATKILDKVYGDKKRNETEIGGELSSVLKMAMNNDKGLPVTIEGKKSK